MLAATTWRIDTLISDAITAWSPDHIAYTLAFWGIIGALAFAAHKLWPHGD